MQIEEVFSKVNKSKNWAEYRQYELGEMLECALSHIITLEVQETHLTQRAPDRLAGGGRKHPARAIKQIRKLLVKHGGR